MADSIPRKAVACRRLGRYVAGLATVLLLTACSGTDGGDEATSEPTTGGTTAGDQAPLPGVTGQITSVDGSRLRVRSDAGETTVTFDDATTLRRVAPVTAAAARPGRCVTARTENKGKDATAPPSRHVLTAVWVQVSDPVSGSCGLGAGLSALRAALAADSTGSPATPARSTSTTGTSPSPVARSGATAYGATNRGNGFGRSGVTGSVVASTDGSLSVQPETKAAASSATAAPTATPRTLSIAIEPATTFSELQAITSSDLVAGRCLAALGKPDQAGTIKASAIVTRESVGGACASAYPPASTR